MLVFMRTPTWDFSSSTAWKSCSLVFQVVGKEYESLQQLYKKGSCEKTTASSAMINGERDGEGNQ